MTTPEQKFCYGDSQSTKTEGGKPIATVSRTPSKLFCFGDQVINVQNIDTIDVQPRLSHGFREGANISSFYGKVAITMHGREYVLREFFTGEEYGKKDVAVVEGAKTNYSYIVNNTQESGPWSTEILDTFQVTVDGRTCDCWFRSIQDIYEAHYNEQLLTGMQRVNQLHKRLITAWEHWI